MPSNNKTGSDSEMIILERRLSQRPIFNVENPNYGNQRRVDVDDVEDYRPRPQRRETDLSTFHLNAGNSRDNDNHCDDSILCSIYDEQGKLINYYHRTTSIHRNIFKDNNETTDFRTFPSSLENRRKWMFCTGYSLTHPSLEDRANDIASCMELDGALMDNTPESLLLRREALRDMPQCLTVKRIIKKKLCSTLSKQSRPKLISCFKGLQYDLSMKSSKIKNWFNSLAYSFELWYNSLKVIEGHFGSGVATYFKYFRWLFIMNVLLTIVALVFVVFPQILYDNFVRPSMESESETLINKFKWFNLQLRTTMENNETFRGVDLFTGEGYFTNTILYYGHYTNQFINLIGNQNYGMPYAYFFTMLCMYLASFVVLSLSMARSYRRSFIETRGGLKNNFAQKIFCGWDYSIATQEAADLKTSSIYHELKELLGESMQNYTKMTCIQRFYTSVIQIACNITILFLLSGTGYVLWLLLKQQDVDETSTTNIGVVTAIVINVIMLLFPPLFSFIVRYEDYKHPRAALYITLLRTFLLKIVVVGVFLAFWLLHSTNLKCWESSIGQHIYRLILFDFLFSVVLAALVEAVCYFIYKKVWRGIGAPKFDIARCTLQLMYNQTLFWVGFYFSPLLGVVVILKLWISWYIRRTCVLHFCEPSSKSWRASQTQTLFLILSFLSLMLVIITLGYIMVDLPSSKCGPFKDYSYMYEMILKGLFQLEHNNVFWKILMYLIRPGVIGLILVAMCVVVYYLRAKAIAQKGMVNILRDMLVLEAKDKEFLLKTISNVTEGQWQYHLPKAEPFNMCENVTDVWSSRKHCNPVDTQNIDDTSSGSDNFRDYRQSRRASQSLLHKEEPKRNYEMHKKKR